MKARAHSWRNVHRCSKDHDAFKPLPVNTAPIPHYRSTGRSLSASHSCDLDLRGTAGWVSAPGTKVQRSGTVSEIGMEVDSVCRQFSIPARAVRMRTVKNAGGAVVRREYRIAVPVDFSSLEFNKEINTRVAEFGARVQGSERTRDRAVTLTVLKNDETLVTILLNLRQEPY